MHELSFLGDKTIVFSLQIFGYGNWKKTFFERLNSIQKRRILCPIPILRNGLSQFSVHCISIKQTLIFLPKFHFQKSIIQYYVAFVFFVLHYLKFAKNSEKLPEKMSAVKNQGKKRVRNKILLLHYLTPTFFCFR